MLQNNKTTNLSLKKTILDVFRVQKLSALHSGFENILASKLVFGNL
jgi:hypothetical protein